MNINDYVNSMNLAENNLDYTNMQICALSDLHLHLKQSIVGTAHKYRNKNKYSHKFQTNTQIRALSDLHLHLKINRGHITQIQAKSFENDEYSQWRIEQLQCVEKSLPT